MDHLLLLREMAALYMYMYTVDMLIYGVALCCLLS